MMVACQWHFFDYLICLDWTKDLDDMADTVADVGPDHDLWESLHRLLLYHLPPEVRLEQNCAHYSDSRNRIKQPVWGQALPPATPHTCFQTPPEEKSLRHSLNNCLLNIFLWFLSHFDDGGTDGEPLASLELCGEAEETAVLHIQVVVHLGRGKLKTPSGQRRRI